MKKSLLPVLVLLGAAILSGAHFDRGERRIRVSGAMRPVTRAEIVVPEGNPVRRFAAGELQSFLKRASGLELPVVAKPTPGVLSLVLGDNALARKAGLDSGKLASEGFVIKREGNLIFILGADDPQCDPKVNRWHMRFKRGTLSAVYDFLERFAGVRFYFPGENGTVVPERKELLLPETIDILDRPDLLTREPYSGGAAVWYELPSTYFGKLTGENLKYLRGRFSEFAIPFGHGLANCRLIERFAKSHPEYFALMPNGKRHCTPDLVHPGHLCFTSAVTEEIYQDMKAFLTGKPATARGQKWWNVNFGSRTFVSAMPQDWLYWCCCDKCAKIAPGARVYQDDPKAAQAISNFLWRWTGDLARRLTAEGVKGTVTQMAYGALSNLPDCELPDNVAIQLAVKGMGAPRYWKDDEELLKKWCAKTRGEISIWTYPGKHMSKAEMKGIPAMMHRQTGLYLKKMRKYIYGSFLESETDYELFNYLNYYTYSRISWDLDTDLEKLLDEHYKVMFGPGADEMKRFFDALEEIWCKKIIGRIEDTPLGPVVKLPNDFEVWQKILSPAVLKSFDALFDRAEKKAAKTPGCLKRIRFMRREMLGPILKAAEKFAAAREAMSEWRFKLPGKVGLRPYKGEVCEVVTTVCAEERPGEFVFTFDCEEPLMNKIKSSAKKKDDKTIFEDSCVELLLNPSGDRKNYCHFIVNADGAYSDAAWSKGSGKGGDYAWESGCKVTAVKGPVGFKITLVLPKKALGQYAKGGFPVNFARHRALDGMAVKEIYYQWSPVPGRSFHAIERWGVMKLDSEGIPRNFLKDGDFQIEKPRLPYSLGAWGLWGNEGYKVKRFELDNRIFLTGTASIRLMNPAGQRVSAGQRFTGLEAGKKYRLSYFLRTKDLKGKNGAGAYLSIGTRQMACPNIRVTGTTSWHRRTFDFTAGKDVKPDTKCVIGLWIWTAVGEAWYDNVSICEVK